MARLKGVFRFFRFLKRGAAEAKRARALLLALAAVLALAQLLLSFCQMSAAAKS